MHRLFLSFDSGLQEAMELLMKKGIYLLLILFVLGCQAGPSLTPEEAKAKWQGPIALSALNAGICPGVKETAQKIQDGDISGFEAFGEVLASSLLIQAVQERLDTAEPSPDQSKFWAQIQSDTDALIGIVGSWMKEESTSADVLRDIDSVCTDTDKTFSEISEAAKKEGLTAEGMGEILDEMTAAMETAVEPTE